MTKVKICGLTTKEHVDVAVNSGADFIGFVFAKSKRQITPEMVAKITIDCPEKIKKVGVFVSPSLDSLIKTIELAGLDMIQLHGKLTKEVENAIETEYFKQKGIKYIHVLSGADDQLIDKINNSQADYLLLDAPSEKEVYAGGNGKSFNWIETSALIKTSQTKKIIIAGGLTTENVKEARDLFNPYAVDVSSGVETNGTKDAKKINQFITNVKEN